MKLRTLKMFLVSSALYKPIMKKNSKRVLDKEGASSRIFLITLLAFLPCYYADLSHESMTEEEHQRQAEEQKLSHNSHKPDNRFDFEKSKKVKEMGYLATVITNYTEITDAQLTSSRKPPTIDHLHSDHPRSKLLKKQQTHVHTSTRTSATELPSPQQKQRGRSFGDSNSRRNSNSNFDDDNDDSSIQEENDDDTVPPPVHSPTTPHPKERFLPTTTTTREMTTTGTTTTTTTTTEPTTPAPTTRKAVTPSPPQTQIPEPPKPPTSSTSSSPGQGSTTIKTGPTPMYESNSDESIFGSPHGPTSGSPSPGPTYGSSIHGSKHGFPSQEPTTHAIAEPSHKSRYWNAACLGLENPKFTKTIYIGSLAAWPTEGTMVHLGIQAHTTDQVQLRYSLAPGYNFLQMNSNQNVQFTHKVREGIYVGPNNVVLIEVMAEVVGDESRSSSAVIAIVLPVKGAVAPHNVKPPHNFETAVEKVKTLIEKPTDEETMELYGLYKQATVGDVNKPRPVMTDLKGKVKWDAWNSYKGMSQDEAKRKYIFDVYQLVEKYGVTES